MRPATASTSRTRSRRNLADISVRPTRAGSCRTFQPRLEAPGAVARYRRKGDRWLIPTIPPARMSFATVLPSSSPTTHHAGAAAAGILFCHVVGHGASLQSNPVRAPSLLEQASTAVLNRLASGVCDCDCAELGAFSLPHPVTSARTTISSSISPAQVPSFEVIGMTIRSVSVVLSANVTAFNQMRGRAGGAVGGRIGRALSALCAHTLPTVGPARANGCRCPCWASVQVRRVYQRLPIPVNHTGQVHGQHPRGA